MKSTKVLANIMHCFASEYIYGFVFYKRPKRFLFKIRRNPNIPLNENQYDFNNSISVCGSRGKQKTSYYGPCFYVDDYKNIFAPAYKIKLSDCSFLSLAETAEVLHCSSDKLAQLIINDLRYQFNTFPEKSKTLVTRSSGVFDNEWTTVPSRQLFTTWDDLVAQTMVQADLHLVE